MADTPEPRDVELMRRLSSGDETAFLEFYRRHQGGLYRFAVHICGRPEFAADVVQETFLTLIRHCGKFDQEKGTGGAFAVPCGDGEVAAESRAFHFARETPPRPHRRQRNEGAFGGQ